MVEQRTGSVDEFYDAVDDAGKLGKSAIPGSLPAGQLNGRSVSGSGSTGDEVIQVSSEGEELRTFDAESAV